MAEDGPSMEVTQTVMKEIQKAIKISFGPYRKLRPLPFAKVSAKHSQPHSNPPLSLSAM